MEEAYKQSEDEQEKFEMNKKKIILGNRKAENYLFNTVSFLLNNKNIFIEKLNNNDIEIELFTSSNLSYIDNIIYRLKLNNNSFNPKRDINKILYEYKKIPPKIEIKDEFYSDEKVFDEININFYPYLHKNINLDLSLFPFWYYNIQKKSIEKYNIKLINKNKFLLCLYISQLNESYINKVSKISEDLNNIENIYDYIDMVYIFFQINTKEEITRIMNDEKLKKIILDNDNDDEKQKIKYIFNILSYYDLKGYPDQIYNIFNDQKKFGKEYFFILDPNNKIVSIKSELIYLIRKIYLFIIRLKKEKKNDENKNILEILKQKEIEKEKNNDIIREIIYFIKNCKKLDYLFNLKFELLFSAIMNEEFNDIKIIKINSINIEGEFRTKEYQYFNKLLTSLKIPTKNKAFILKEMVTINIDIDFSDMKCFKCTKIIPDDKHLYYCYICKTKYCYECVHEQLKKNGKEKYIDQKHNLLFFKTRDKKQFLNLDKKKLGNNRFAESTNDDQFDENHKAWCNGCGCRFHKMARYVCLHCRPGLYLEGGYVDYCQTCIDTMCVDEDNKKQLEKRAEEDISSNINNFTKNHILSSYHKHDNHIYLMLPLQYNAIEEELNIYNSY